MGDSHPHTYSSSAVAIQSAGCAKAPNAWASAVPAILLLGLALAGEVRAADPIILKGSTATAYYPTFSSDGKRLAMGYDDGIARVWDVPARKKLGEVPGGCPALSPDGKKLAISDKGVVTVWDTETWKVLTNFPGEVIVSSIAFSPDSKVVAIGGYGGRVRLWDLAKEKVIDELASDIGGHNANGPIAKFLFTADGKILVYATGDGTIKVYDIKGRKVLAILKGERASAQALAFSKDGKLLAYPDRQGDERQQRPRVKFWDIASGKDAGEMLLLNGHITFLRQLDDGKTWVTRVDYRTDLQAVDPGMTRRDLLLAPHLFRAAEHEGSLRCVAVSPDRKKLLLSVRNEVRIIDMPDFPPKDAKKKSEKADK